MFWVFLFVSLLVSSEYCNNAAVEDLSIPQRWLKANNFFRCRHGLAPLVWAPPRIGEGNGADPESRIESYYQRFRSGETMQMMSANVEIVSCQDTECEYQPADSDYSPATLFPHFSESICCAQVYDDSDRLYLEDFENTPIFWVSIENVTAEGFDLTGYWTFSQDTWWAVSEGAVPSMQTAICEGSDVAPQNSVFHHHIPCHMKRNTRYTFWIGNLKKDGHLIFFGTTPIYIPETTTPHPSMPSMSPSFSPSVHPSTSLPTLTPTTSRPTSTPTTSFPTRTPSTSWPTRSPTTGMPTASPIAFMNLNFMADYNKVIVDNRSEALFIAEINAVIFVWAPDVICIAVVPALVHHRHGLLRAILQGPYHQFEDIYDEIEDNGLYLTSFGRLYLAWPHEPKELIAECGSDVECGSEDYYCSSKNVCDKYRELNSSCNAEEKCSPPLTCLATNGGDAICAPSDVENADTHESSGRHHHASVWIYIWLTAFIVSTAGLFTMLFIHIHRNKNYTDEDQLLVDILLDVDADFDYNA